MFLKRLHAIPCLAQYIDISNHGGYEAIGLKTVSGKGVEVLGFRLRGMTFGNGERMMAFKLHKAACLCQQCSTLTWLACISLHH